MKNIVNIWLTETEVWIRTDKGEEVCELFSNYPRLLNASQSQRENFVADRHGVHWPDLDEDLSYDGFFKKKSTSPLYRFFIDHPELNASAIARKMKISQSLLAQYITGIKTPSAQRLQEIQSTIRNIGKELSEIDILE